MHIVETRMEDNGGFVLTIKALAMKASTLRRVVGGNVRMFVYAVLIMMVVASQGGFSFVSVAQAATTGWFSPTSNSGDFTDGIAGQADGGDEVEIRQNQVHYFYGYNFSIPENVVIDGISIGVDDLYGGGESGIRNLGIEISVDGGNTFSSTGSQTPDIGLSSNDYIFGGSNDLWGLSIDQSSLVNGDFVIRVTASDFGNSGRLLWFDWIPALVHYTEVGSISGYKWDDANADGVWDADEQPLSGVEVVLSGDLSGSYTTGADGFYEFSPLPEGDYSVSETVPAGYVQSAPDAGQYDISVGSGSWIHENNDFGNYAAGTATVCLRDVDTDALLDNWDVTLSMNTNGSYADVVTHQTTNGCVTFDSLAVGEYAVTQTLEQNWARVSPVEGDSFEFTVVPGFTGNFEFTNEEIICPMPIDAVVLIDISNSMGECSDPFYTGLGKVSCEFLGETWSDTLLDNAKVLANTFVDQLTTDDQVSLVVFAGTPSTEVVLPLGQATSDYKTQVQAAITALASGNGGTFLGGGLELANEQLASSLTPKSSEKILLFTDGHPTLPSQPGTVTNGEDLTLVEAEYQSAQLAGHHIYTFGMSSAVDETLLSAMSVVTGGEYFAPVASADDMLNIFNDNKFGQCDGYVPNTGDTSDDTSDDTTDDTTDDTSDTSDDSNESDTSSSNTNTGNTSSGGGGSVGRPDIEVSISSLDAVINAGGQAQIAVMVENKGSARARDVVLTVALPEGFSFPGTASDNSTSTDSVSAAAFSIASAVSIAVSDDGRTQTWDLGDLDKRSEEEVSFMVAVDATTDVGEYATAASAQSQQLTGDRYFDQKELMMSVTAPQVLGFTDDATGTDTVTNNDVADDTVANDAVQTDATSADTATSDGVGGDIANDADPDTNVGASEAVNSTDPSVLGFQALPETGGRPVMPMMLWVIGSLLVLLGAGLYRYGSAREV